VTRALAALTCLALLTVVVEATDDPHPLLAVALGVTYAVHALAALPWPARQPMPRQYWLTAGHVCLQLPLGALLFGAAHAGVGATLLLLVLVAQSVLLLPLPAAAVVTALVALVHAGMGRADFARNGLGLLGAAVFTAVVTALLQRESRAQGELAEANERLRGYAAQAEELGGRGVRPVPVHRRARADAARHGAGDVVAPRRVRPLLSRTALARRWTCPGRRAGPSPRSRWVWTGRGGPKGSPPGHGPAQRRWGTAPGGGVGRHAASVSGGGRRR
jgi:hypothetical protein